jgi:hypothetical protein
LKDVPEATDNATVFIMCDKTEELGYAVADIQSSAVRMLFMDIAGNDSYSDLSPETRICADSLMRAVASYGANNGAYRIESHIEFLDDFFLTLGFQRNKNAVYTNLDNIIKICKK